MKQPYDQSESGLHQRYGILLYNVYNISDWPIVMHEPEHNGWALAKKKGFEFLNSERITRANSKITTHTLLKCSESCVAMVAHPRLVGRTRRLFLNFCTVILRSTVTAHVWEGLHMLRFQMSVITLKKDYRLGIILFHQQLLFLLHSKVWFSQLLALYWTPTDHYGWYHGIQSARTFILNLERGGGGGRRERERERETGTFILLSGSFVPLQIFHCWF